MEAMAKQQVQIVLVSKKCQYRSAVFLYCGGSEKFSDEADHCKHVRIHYEYELFDCS
jgi:hypothetical protein